MYFIPLIVTVLLLPWLLFACTKVAPELTNLKQDPYIQVYFNHKQTKKTNYQEFYRQIERYGDNLEAIIIEEINSADHSIDVAVQELRLPKVAQALAQKYQQGVKVRVILDNNYNRSLSEFTSLEIGRLNQRDRLRYQEFFTLVDSNKDGRLSQAEIEQKDALVILRNAGIPVIDDTADGSKGSGLMHHKFVIVDRQKVVTGSANFTLSGVHGDFANLATRGNVNNLMVIDNQQLATIFTTEFNSMWGDGLGGKQDSKFGLAKPARSLQQVSFGDNLVTIQFSPASPTQDWQSTTNGIIGTTLNRANRSIDLALFVFSEQKLADLLQRKQQEGVAIRALFDRGFAFRYYSEALDLLGVALRYQCKYEQGNNPWQEAIESVGVASLPTGDKLHHKFALIDGHTVITGSHNWSAAANHSNDETLLIIHNPRVAAHFQQEFDRMYQQADLGLPQHLLAKLKREQSHNCQ